MIISNKIFILTEELDGVPCQPNHQQQRLTVCNVCSVNSTKRTSILHPVITNIVLVLQDAFWPERVADFTNTKMGNKGLSFTVCLLRANIKLGS